MDPLDINPIRTQALAEEIEKRGMVVFQGLVAASTADSPEHRFPFEREMQIQAFLINTARYAHDLRQGYWLRRMDLLSQTIRSLMELDVRTEFCNVSESNWKRFMDDGFRDMRDLAELVLKMKTPWTKEIYDEMAAGFAELHKDAKKFGIANFAGPYTSDRDAAKEIGRGEEYGLRYRYYSKFAHPTALWIMLIMPMPNHRFDGAYAEGARFAEKCLKECEKAVAEKYPDVVKRTENK
jgi:hypothetical protein